ncbi:MAG: Grx4 family monothiol glutaredoxin [Alphaproteobacteria bacterium]|nr:MAG: Grx4 family monothiol glutaredoxin [Alphaproteobacteria bacterium]
MSEHPAFDDIKRDLKENDIVLFMKGSPMFPQCGFSATAVEILNRMGLEFKSVDVLADDNVREGIKAFSDWPTVPQLYVKGEFVGGCDIMREMYEAGELHQFMKTAGFEPTLA